MPCDRSVTLPVGYSYRDEPDGSCSILGPPEPGYTETPPVAPNTGLPWVDPSAPYTGAPYIPPSGSFVGGGSETPTPVITWNVIIIILIIILALSLIGGHK